MMTDPIADMLTRIRNAARARQNATSCPSSRLKLAVARVLENAGYLDSVRVEAEEGRAVLKLDIRYRDAESFERGEHFQIIELNGAGAIASHVWDPRCPLKTAYRTLFRQLRLTFAIAARNRDAGHRPIGAKALIRDLWTFRRLAASYPKSA